MQNLKTKLASRKFWTMLIGLITSLLIAFNVDPNTVAQVTAIVTAFGSIVAYILAEAYVDGKQAGYLQGESIELESFTAELKKTEEGEE
ncbi:hypothetical protein ACPA0F_18540 [Solibacillus silvestris]